MTGSIGAASAAMSGRGNRTVEKQSEYQVVLPGLPTGRFVLNTVFLHADVAASPYRVEDFRDALADQSLLSDVIALGAYHMSHVWAITLKDAEAVKRITGIGELLLKKRRCLVIDPANQGVRLKLRWLLHSVPGEEVRAAFAPYGKVSETVRKRWRVHGMTEKGSTTRLVTLKMKAGVKFDDLPHQLSVGGELALVVVIGRPPLCLRIRSTGHIRKECRAPRCGVCRRLGHEDGQCARTYASIAGPGTSEDSSELLIDEADAEEATGSTMLKVKQDAPSLSLLTKQKVTAASDDKASEKVVDAPSEDDHDSQKEMTKVCVEAPEGGESSRTDAMHVTQEMAASMAGKRPQEESVGKKEQYGDGSDEPPPKTPGMRCSTLKPRPNLSAETRQAGKPPP
ncbi:uncharacterized protein LOC144098156 [Amblyomma americanum]